LKSPRIFNKIIVEGSGYPLQYSKRIPSELKTDAITLRYVFPNYLLKQLTYVLNGNLREESGWVGKGAMI
jgi:hypothetical protein